MVVGSGFGGAVTAYRLAVEASGWVWSVVILKRGQPTRPAPSSRTPPQMRRGLWDPPDRLNRTGSSSSGASATSTCGPLSSPGCRVAHLRERDDRRRSEETFVLVRTSAPAGREHWPIPAGATSRSTTATCASMQGAHRFPADVEPYASTSKRRVAIEDAAGWTLGLTAEAPRSWRCCSRRPGGGDPVPGGSGAGRQSPPPAADDLRAVRRVRPGLQLRGEEHARLHVPDPRPAAEGPRSLRTCCEVRDDRAAGPRTEGLPDRLPAARRGARGGVTGPGPVGPVP